MDIMLKKIKILLIASLILSACSAPEQFITEKSWASRTLKKLTLREKIAQMMVYNMNMSFLNSESRQWLEIQELLASDGIGHLHFWFGDAGSSLTLLNEIQKKSKIPILVNADVESGIGRRYPSGTQFPPLMAIAATGDPQNAYLAGKISAIESRAVGIHLNLAPVLDVNNNPKNPIINTRSFGESPDLVTRFGLEYIRGLSDFGMLTTAKHFPGHGDTETDSHSSLAQIPSDSLRLWTVELSPFKAAIDQGVDLFMIAHLTSPDYQPSAEEPATMSNFWIQDILKDRLAYRGGIITDAMRMGGITQNYSDDYALIQTIKAGSDIIIQKHKFKNAIDVVEKAVLSGEIPLSRINEAAYVTLLLKEKAGLHKINRIDFESVQKTLGINEHKKIARKMASEAITLVKNEGDLIPLNPSLDDTLYIFDIYDYNHNHTESAATKKLKSGGRKTLTFQIDKSDSLDYINAQLSQVPENALIIVNAFVNPVEHKDEIFLPEVEAGFLHALNLRSKRLILTSFGSPYIIQEFPETPVYICAYKGSGLMNTAVADALLGKKDISGKLTVSIPGVAVIGDGLNIKGKTWKNGSRNNRPGTRLLRVMPYEIKAQTEPVLNYMQAAVADSAWPGAVLLAARKGKIFIHEAAGFHTYDKLENTNRGDIFDLASITKVVATTSAVMQLYEQGKLDLDDKVVKYLPKFKGRQAEYFNQKNNISIKNLLTHSAGLPPFKQYYLMGDSKEARLDSIYNTAPETGIAEKTIYSDVGVIILGKIIEKISGLSLDIYSDSMIFKPLGMKSTYFNPPAERMKRIVPTEFDQPSGFFTRGQVHDENSRSLDGVAGHAGLFSSAYDLGLFSQTMLNGGLYGWKRIFKKETVELFTKPALVVNGSSRCLGWDSPSGKASGGIYLSTKSFGHTGFTGTSMWIDPENEIVVILLTNAVHPERANKSPKYYDWRQRIHSAVYESVGLNQQNPELKKRERWRN